MAAGCMINTKFSIAEGLRPLFVPITSALVISVPHDAQQEVVDIVPVGQYTAQLTQLIYRF